jgi:hypothetical protein
MASMTYRRWLTAMVGCALVAVCGFDATAAAPAAAPCRGAVRVRNTGTGKVVGVIAKQLNSYGEYVVTAASTKALTVQVGSGGNLIGVNSSDRTYPDVGGIQGFYTKGPDLSSSSPNYSTLGATAQTKTGAKPAKGRNSYSDATGMPQDIESALWSFGSGGALTPTWINSNSAHAPTHLVEIEGVLVLTGDPKALATELGQSATAVSLRLNRTSGTCT